MKKTRLPNNITEFCWPSLRLLILLATLGILNIWAALGFTQISPLSSESAKHLSKAYQMFWQINCHWPWPDILNTITYPPCFYLNTVCWFQLFKHQSEALALLSVTPYLIISAWSTYSLIKKATKPTNNTFLSFVGAFTCLALLSSSLLVEGYLIEYALMAWLSVSFCLFTTICEKKLSLGQLSTLVIVCSLGMLTKWTFLSYLVPLLACVFANILLNIAKKRYTKIELGSLLLKAVLVVTTTFFFCGLWYGARHGENSNLDELLAHFTRSQNSETIIQTDDPVFLHGFRAHTPHLYKFGPLNFAVYMAIHVIPPHLTIMLLIGFLIALGHFYMRLHSLDTFNNSKNSAPLESHSVANLTKLKVFTTEETVIASSLLFALIFYSLYPTPDLFVPEKSVRHLAPLAPAAIALAFIWLSRLGRRQAWILIPCLIISAATMLHWALPQHSTWRGHILLGPSLPTTIPHQFGDPLGIFTPPYSSPLEKLCYQIAQKAENKELLVSLVNKEDFDPFFTELYAYWGSKPILLRQKNNQLVQLDPLTQVPLAQTFTKNKSPQFIVQRYQVTWLGYPQIQTVPELPDTFYQIPISTNIPNNTYCFYTVRAGQIDAYLISELYTNKN